ncbi:MAG: ABC transporter permease [Gemmatimonadota bacterium]|nr:ABC transporter permease [Gemmatimonadota bacterium]
MSTRTHQKGSVLERLFSGHHDVLAALRSLRRSPGFVAIAVLSLGLAIGLNTTTLAMMDAILHPYVPYPHAERLFDLTPYGITRQKVWVKRPMYLGVRARHDLYANIVPYVMSVGVIDANGTQTQGFGYTVGTELFDVLGVRPVLGRAFHAADSDAANASAAVIAYQVWQQDFGGAKDLSNLHLTYAGRTYSVIGVMPPSVYYPGNATLWTAMPKAQESSADGAPWVWALLELKPGDTPARVKAQLDAMATQYAAEYNGDRTQFDYRLDSIIPRGRAPRSATLLATVVALLILLVACLNLANLMLARALGRRRELAVRMAIGASRWAIVRHVLVECGLLAVLGGAWGVLLSAWGVQFAEGHMPAMIRQMGFSTPHMSWRVVALGVAVTATTILVAGLAPAIQAARANVNEVMKDGGGSSTGRHSRLYRFIVVGELGLALGVSIIAMTFFLGLRKRENIKFPFAADQTFTASVLPARTCQGPDGTREFWPAMVRRVAAVQGVSYAAALTTMWPEGQTVTSDEPGTPIERVLGQGRQLGYWMATTDIFRLYGFPIVAGRDFEPGDADSAGAAIVSRDLASRLWPLSSPVGRLLKLGSSKSRAPWVRVVGVVGPLTGGSDSTMNGAPDLTVVGPMHCVDATLAIRIAGNRPDIPGTVYHLVRAAVPAGGRVTEFRSTQADYEASLRESRVTVYTFLACGVFSLVLSVVGVYGVLSYTVGQRTREFAMRTALGARSPDIARMVAREAMEMVLGGTAFGEIGAVATAFPVIVASGSMAFVIALVAAELVVVVAALAACAGPIRRATRADPVALLRAT